MKFLKSWLQDYIVEILPEDAAIKDALNKKAFEVEEVIPVSGDTIYDIKVLPNRAHDAFGHRGMAREIVADFAYTFKEDLRILKNDSFLSPTITTPVVAIDDAQSCTRFMSIRIDEITVGDSPDWLKKRLESIGQRSINNIVDITNYVQFSLNKPMHAYDARSIKGTLHARFAKASESLTTLDDKELKLDEKTLVITDDEKVLGLAGIKGGKFSGIKSDTTSVILESANFSPTLIRKTSQAYDIRTDASKRFENGIANSLIEEGLHMTANLIKEICPDAKASAGVDIYPNKDLPGKVRFSLNEINKILGANYTSRDIVDTLKRLAFNIVSNEADNYFIEVPSERLDIRIKEDVAEEIGRIIGYEKLVPVLPKLNRQGILNKRTYYANKVREILITNGFSEVITYTFGNSGIVELVKGTATDKEKLRSSLGEGITSALSLNLYNAPLLGQDTIKIFEFGNVFTKEAEEFHLAIALDDSNHKTNFSQESSLVLAEIKRTLGVEDLHGNTVSAKPHVVEIDFDSLIDTLKEPNTYEPTTFSNLPVVSYKSIPPYPFVARDIAMWVPDNITWEDIHNLTLEIHNHLINRIDLFDTFSKEKEGVKRTSYAFRLVFQASDRTLTDEEVNKMMEPYYELFKSKGFEIR